GDKTITEIAFDLTHNSGTSNILPNFKIIFKPTTATTLTGAFANTSDGTIVFQAPTYQMPAPAATGWHTWDVEDYVLPAGQNLIIEVVWGLLDDYCGSGDEFTVNGTQVAENRAAYGYSDSELSPGYDGSSNILPNLFVTFEATEEPVSHNVTFTVTEDGTTPLEGASVKIGSATYLTNTDGVVNISLYEGDYIFGATKTGYSKVENQELALTEDKNIAISLSRVMYINFNIIGQWNTVVTDAVVTLNDQAYPAGQYMIEGLVAGSYTYSINALHYFPKTGQIDITEFDNQIDIELIADGTELDNNNQSQLSVYPNPAKDVLNVRLGNTLTADVQIINIIGEVVSSHKVVNGALNINTQSLPVGTYFVRIMTNEKLTVKKVSIVR
ncbi:MAG: T9SS type A sorting domain-containing protein, partial [Bacteroidales bacterium]|nr:T9SS type A sorting domain-containing protein [Bacteroidales bacterium]